MNEHDTPRALLERINGLLSCYTHLDADSPLVAVRDDLAYAIDNGDGIAEAVDAAKEALRRAAFAPRQKAGAR